MDDRFTHHALPLPTGMLIVFCTWVLTQSLSYSSTPPVATLSGLGSSISSIQVWASLQALSIIAFLFTLSVPLSTVSQSFSEIVHLPFQGLSRYTHLLTLPPVPSCWPVCWSLGLPGTTSSGSLSIKHFLFWCPGDLLYSFKSKVLCFQIWHFLLYGTYSVQYVSHLFAFLCICFSLEHKLQDSRNSGLSLSSWIWSTKNFQNLLVNELCLFS